MEESKSLHMQSSEWSLSQKSANRPPFDPYFNCGKSVGGASQADLLAATARAGGGLPEWQESCSHQQVLSPDKCAPPLLPPPPSRLPTLDPNRCRGQCRAAKASPLRFPNPNAEHHPRHATDSSSE
eukprot:3936192-Rhodomonas_salina.1